MMSQEEKIEITKQRIIEDRIRGNEERIHEYNKPKNKRKKPLRLLDTTPNFFVGANDRGFCVMHLEAFRKLSKSKQEKLINMYR